MKENIDLMRKQIKKYLDTADENTLTIVHTILEAADEADDPLMNMTPEQEQSFRRGLSDANAGRVVPHAEVMNKYKQWLSK